MPSFQAPKCILRRQVNKMCSYGIRSFTVLKVSCIPHPFSPSSQILFSSVEALKGLLFKIAFKIVCDSPINYVCGTSLFSSLFLLHTGASTMAYAEAEFLDIIGTKLLRVFLLAIQSQSPLLTEFYSPPQG